MKVMITDLIIYFAIGVGFNALYDYAVGLTSEEHRFTMKERLIVVAIWPIALLMFVFYGFKSCLK